MKKNDKIRYLKPKKNDLLDQIMEKKNLDELGLLDLVIIEEMANQKKQKKS